MIGRTHSLETAETMTFMTLVFSQLFHALNARSNKESLFKINFFQQQIPDRVNRHRNSPTINFRYTFLK